MIGILAAIIYPTVNASMQWGEMQSDLRANTKAVREVAEGLQAIAKEQVKSDESVMVLQNQISTVIDVNGALVKENAKLRAAVNHNGAVVKDNTQAVDWHSYRLHQLEDVEANKRH